MDLTSENLNSFSALPDSQVIHISQKKLLMPTVDVLKLSSAGTLGVVVLEFKRVPRLIWAETKMVH